jgi:hypothetical protein
MSEAMRIEALTRQSIAEIVVERGWVTPDDLTKVIEWASAELATPEEESLPTAAAATPAVPAEAAVVPHGTAALAPPPATPESTAAEPPLASPPDSPTEPVPDPEPAGGPVVPPALEPADPPELPVEPDPEPELPPAALASAPPKLEPMAPEPPLDERAPEPTVAAEEPSPTDEPPPGPRAVPDLPAPEREHEDTQPIELRPTPTAPRPAVAGTVRVVVRLRDGQQLVDAAFAEPQAARSRAEELVDALESEDEWPFIAGRSIDPLEIETIFLEKR